jgi:uncharacterized protein YgbK (DUF1537 family)
MNSELIKTLADEARIKPMGSSWAYRLSDEFEEKFAELIVKECAQEFDNTYMSGGKTMGAYIREKFGVKE